MAKDQSEIEGPRVIAHVSASTRVRTAYMHFPGWQVSWLYYSMVAAVASLGSIMQGQLLVEPCAYKEFQQHCEINADACGVHELYPRTLVSTTSVLRCPSHKKARVSMLRAALGHADSVKNEQRGDVPKADAKLRRTVSSTLDTQSSYQRRQHMRLTESIAE
jgi:hypothetical protein